MKKILLSIDENIHDIIKSQAKIEQRSVANYIKVFIENSFKYTKTDTREVEDNIITDSKDEYIELKKLGKMIRIKTNVDNNLSDHAIGWLHKNNTKTYEDYKKVTTLIPLFE